MCAFIATRANNVRATLSCMDSGREATMAACAGVVVVNVPSNLCLGVVPRNAALNPGAARLSGCHGGIQQRWHLLARREIVELAVASNGNCLSVTGGSPVEGATVQQSACAGVDGQLFSLRRVGKDTQIVAKISGQCVAATPGPTPDAAPLVLAACAQDAAQTWRLQRSIYQ